MWVARAGRWLAASSTAATRPHSGTPSGLAGAYAGTAAKTAGSPAELGAASDLVCLCVVGDDDVRQVLFGGTTAYSKAWPPGGIVVIHSTIHPDTCREIAERAAGQGVSVIDAPVSGGGAPAVEAGQLLVMVGGAEADVEKARPVFATYADRSCTWAPPWGAGRSPRS